ncbi:hypothetical protein WS75_14010 [Burkholderia sp. FL-7-2-10-S1-D7]|uniref:hypothetical protein n=1 Tax=Burkholderia sp. FL-7-2-10-S1-D7 TaxID=1637866 RepID=UPI00075AB0FA|nr:hypothetical protein [Burkholderia sp. FL-7-2-10-S1-D7]KVF75917.1 hypothetical protein WS75_14010 [Burkholderia sp. FL-7-2-10-S1-D7]
MREGTGNVGYNPATGKFVDLVEAGIVDPTTVTRTALQDRSLGSSTNRRRQHSGSTVRKKRPDDTPGSM